MFRAGFVSVSKPTDESMNSILNSVYTAYDSLKSLSHFPQLIVRELYSLYNTERYYSICQVCFRLVRIFYVKNFNILFFSKDDKESSYKSKIVAAGLNQMAYLDKCEVLFEQQQSREFRIDGLFVSSLFLIHLLCHYLKHILLL